MTPDDLDKLIVDESRRIGALADTCHFVDYHPDIGRVPEHFEPRADVRQIVIAVLAAHGIKTA